MPPPFQPRVSIVIPVYNGANYLAEAIDSALAQTYPDFEVIVVNDGSNDDGATRRIAQGYGQRIRFLEQENGGCAAALNTGIRAMTGTYFSWLSHDDLYEPDKLRLQIDVLGGLENKETVLFSNYCVINAAGHNTYQSRIEHLGSPAQLDTPLYALTHGAMHGCSMLLARRLLEHHGLFDTRLKTTQDYDLWFRILHVTPVRFMHQSLIRSRAHEAQGSRTMPEVQPEGISLWQRFIEEVTPEEAAAMDGSRYRYLRRLARFLPQTPYSAAASLAAERAEEAFADIPVSVVLPFRNRLKWTRVALESALAQTHPCIEIVLIDDGSDEDSGPLLDFAEQHPRIRHRRIQPSGAGAARNAGVELATGHYIAFLDSDDFWAPEKITRQLRFMEDRGLGFSHTDYIRLQDETGEEQLVQTSYFSGQCYPHIIAGCPIATPTVMMRTDSARAHPFPEGRTPGEDIITWTNIAAEQEFGALAEPLATVRISSETISASPEKTLLGTVNILEACLAHPQHQQQHRELHALIKLVHNQQLARQLLAVPPTQTSGRVGTLRPYIHSGWLLLRMGLSSLRNDGLRTTWQRVRRFQARRN